MPTNIKTVNLRHISDLKFEYTEFGKRIKILEYSPKGHSDVCIWITADSFQSYPVPFP